MTDPELTISATEASRSFFKLLRAAKGGASVTITVRGRPVARLKPANEGPCTGENERRRDVLDALREHWRTVAPTIAGPWRREDLYERE
jgi:prevent-host-death family protein